MKIRLLALVLCFSAGIPAALAAGQTYGDDDKANQELAKELEDYNKQAEQVIKQVDQLANLNVAPAAKERIDATKERALKLANDDRFLQSVKDLWNSDKRNLMLACQAGWFLFMLLFKAWRQSKAHHWFRRLLVGFVCSLFTWVGISYVIPLAVLGQPFVVFTGTLWRVLVMGQ
jgi:hypothetical protein